MSEDLIRNEGPKVLAQITIQIVEGPGGGLLHLVHSSGERFDEFHARYMMDKARVTLDDHFRMANAPRIAPVNGSLKHLPAPIKRHFHHG